MLSCLKSSFYNQLLMLALLATAFMQNVKADELHINNAGRAALGTYHDGKFSIVDSFGGAHVLACGARAALPAVSNLIPNTINDLVAYEISSGTWHLCADQIVQTLSWGAPGDLPIPGAYNADALSDFAVFRPSNNTWFILSNASGTIDPGISNVQVFGELGDAPTPGDYDGDGVLDFSVFRARVPGDLNSQWLIRQTPTLTLNIPLGQAGDIPAPADFDGDGKTDPTVWRPSDGTWNSILSSTSSGVTAHAFGKPGDIPTPVDFDGDGKADFVLFRPTAGEWVVDGSQGLTQTFSALTSVGVVASNSLAVFADRPAFGDFNGDRVTDLGVVRFGKNDVMEILLNTGTGATHPQSSLTLGRRGDIIVPLDFNGDRISDLAVVSSESGQLTWQIKLFGLPTTETTLLKIPFGVAGDFPLSADVDGDGRSDLGVTRTTISGSRLWILAHSQNSSLESFQFGSSTDTTFLGDIDGDRRADAVIAAVKDGVWNWKVRNANGNELSEVNFGTSSGKPLLLDGDGDGVMEFAVREISGAEEKISFHSIVGESLRNLLVDSGSPLSGVFQGNGIGLSAAWNVVSGQGFFNIRRMDGTIVQKPFGVQGDKALDFSGPIETVERVVQPPVNLKLSCLTQTAVEKQKKGFVWKPKSSKDGRLAVLFEPKLRRKIKQVALVVLGTDKDTVFETLKFGGYTDSGQAIFRGKKSGGRYPAGIVLVRKNPANENVCIAVAKPSRSITK